MPISGSSTIHTVGAATFGSTFASSGSVTCSALLARNSGGTVSGSGTLQAVGVTTLGNALNVSGAVAGGSTISGSGLISGQNLRLDNNSSIGSPADTDLLGIGDGLLTVNGMVRGEDAISGSNVLHICGPATFSSTIATTGSISGNGVTSYGGFTMSSGHYSGSGDFHTNGHVTAGGNILATGSLTANGVTSTNGVITNGVTSTAAYSGSSTFHNVGAATFSSTIATTGSITAPSFAGGSITATTYSGSSTLQNVGAATFGGSVSATGSVITKGSVNLLEKSNADSDVAAYGQIWVKTATPNELYFTTDAGNDIQITTGTGLVVGTPTSLSGTTAQLTTGVETSGYLKVTGSSTFAGDVTIDKDYSDTDAAAITGIEIDFDKTGASTSNNTMYGVKVDMDNTTATNGANYMYGLHVTPTLTHAADAGDSLVFGAFINAQAGTNGTGIAQAARFEAGGGDLNFGIVLDCEDGGTDFRIESSADNGDYFQIQTTTHGATTITTVDDNAIAAHLTFNVDGDITLDPVGGDVFIDGNISGSSTLHAVGAATLGSTLTTSGSITTKGSVNLLEKSNADSDTAAYGQLWVKTATPNQLYFTTDAGDDIQITTGTSLVAGTPTSLSGTTAQLTTGVETSGYLKVTGSTTLAGTLGAQAITATTYSGSGGMQVVGATILGNNLTVSGTTAIQGLLAQGVEATTYSGSSTLHSVGAATLGSTLTTTGSVTSKGSVNILEKSNADSDVAAYGQIWVKTATPNQLYFTTDAGDDIQITSGTSLVAGTPTAISGTTAQLTTGVETSGYLKVTGSTTLVGTLGAQAITATTYSGSSTLHSVGAATFSSTIASTGSITGNGVTSFGGFTMSSGHYSGSGDFHTVGNVTAGGNITVTGSVAANGVTSYGGFTMASGHYSGSGDFHTVGHITAGGNILATGSLQTGGSVNILEKSNADSDVAAYGQLWVKTASPNQLYFTTDAGDDIQITSGTSLVAGTPTAISGTTAQLTTGVETSGYLKVTGSTTLVGTLGAQAITATTYSGSSTLHSVGAATFSSTIASSGSITATSFAGGSITGTTYSGSSTLHSVGIASFSSTILTTGSITTNADLTVGGGDIALGNGQNGTLSISNAAGTNTAGRDLTISAGNGTGTGAPGIMQLKVPKVGTSGDTVHTSVSIIDVMAEGPNFHWNQATALVNDTGNGDIIYMGTGTTTAGKMYYLHSGSSWQETDITTAASGGIGMLGIAIGSNPASNGMLIRGFYDVHSYLSGTFTVGQPLYVTGPAKVGVNRPSGSGEIVRVVGYMTTTSNVIYFNPSSDYIVLV